MITVKKAFRGAYDILTGIVTEREISRRDSNRLESMLVGLVNLSPEEFELRKKFPKTPPNQSKKKRFSAEPPDEVERVNQKSRKESSKEGRGPPRPAHPTNVPNYEVVNEPAPMEVITLDSNSEAESKSEESDAGTRYAFEKRRKKAKSEDYVAEETSSESEPDEKAETEVPSKAKDDESKLKRLAYWASKRLLPVHQWKVDRRKARSNDALFATGCK